MSPRQPEKDLPQRPSATLGMFKHWNYSYSYSDANVWMLLTVHRHVQISEFKYRWPNFERALTTNIYDYALPVLIPWTLQGWESLDSPDIKVTVFELYLKFEIFFSSTPDPRKPSARKAWFGFKKRKSESLSKSNLASTPEH